MVYRPIRLIEAVAVARKTTGLTHGKLAALIGMERPRFSEVLNGTRTLAVRQMKQLSQALGKTPKYLFGKEYQKEE